MNFDEINREIDDYVHVLDEVAEAYYYALVALYVTDIIKNGSYVIFNTKGSNIMDVAYQTDVNQGYFVEGWLSRKKHVIPLIMEVIE